MLKSLSGLGVLPLSRKNMWVDYLSLGLIFDQSLKFH